MRPLAVALTLALAAPAWAEEPEAALVADVDFAPIEQGAPAPFPGILLSETQFLGVARQRLLVDELGAKVGIRDRLILELTGRLAAAQAATTPACEGESWLGRNGFWIGLGVGTVVVAGLVYGAVAVLDTR